LARKQRDMNLYLFFVLFRFLLPFLSHANHSKIEETSQFRVINIRNASKENNHFKRKEKLVSLNLAPFHF